MATILREWSYQYQWLYDSISRVAALSVGGEARFRQLALQGLSVRPGMRVLDLCCGSGQATQYVIPYFTVANAEPPQVVGLDASPRSIDRAQQNVPTAEYVQGWAESMPLPEAQFDVVHTSVALHEMKPDQLRQILSEVHRVLKPGGYFTCVDFHRPTQPLLFPGLALFLWLFETETAWQLLETDLVALCQQIGFVECRHQLHVGGSLQVLQAQKAGAIDS